MNDTFMVLFYFRLIEEKKDVFNDPIKHFTRTIEALDCVCCDDKSE